MWLKVVLCVFLWLKVVLFVQKWLYVFKSGSVWSKVVYEVKSGFMWL